MSERTAAEVRALRDAFADGVHRGLHHAHTQKGIGLLAGADVWIPNEAARRYPMPMVTVDRVILASNGLEYRVTGGELQSREPGREWHWSTLRACDVRDLTHLLANPTEQREAEWLRN